MTSINTLVSKKKIPISQFPAWSYPWVIKLHAELLNKGNIENYNISDPNCVQIISSIDDKYRIDYISKTGIATSYISSELAKIAVAELKDMCLLESAFGTPSSSASPSPSSSSPLSLPRSLSKNFTDFLDSPFII